MWQTWLSIPRRPPTRLPVPSRRSSVGANGDWGSPVLSVVLPAYNAAATIRAAAESVLNGTTAALELIIVDDGSTDGTGAAVVDLLADDRVRLISRPHEGLAASLNAAIAEAS